MARSIWKGPESSRLNMAPSLDLGLGVGEKVRERGNQEKEHMKGEYIWGAVGL